MAGMLRKHQWESGPVGGGGSSSSTGDPTTLGAATVENEAAALSPNVIGRGADIVSQGSAPAGSSRTARSPSLSDSLRDSAADRSLTSPPSVADAAPEGEAAALSPNVIGRGADIVSQGSAPASSSRTARSPSLSDSLRDSAAGRSLISPPSVADAAPEGEAAALSSNVIGRGADIVSQGSAPAGSSRTARSPSRAASRRDSAAGRSLTSPPSVADAASEDEAAALSRK